MTPLRQRPDIRLVPAFLSGDERMSLLAWGAALDRLADLGVEVHEDRTGRHFELPIDGDPALEAVRARIEALLRFESAMGETFRYRCYGPGQFHPGHLDCYRYEDHELVVTAMLVLQHARAGGETVFPRAEDGELRARPEAGDLLLWWNHTPDGERDPQTWHLSAPVLSGEKVTMTYFMYAPTWIAGQRPLAP